MILKFLPFSNVIKQCKLFIKCENYLIALIFILERRSSQYISTEYFAKHAYHFFEHKWLAKNLGDEENHLAESSNFLLFCNSAVNPGP